MVRSEKDKFLSGFVDGRFFFDISRADLFFIPSSSSCWASPKILQFLQQHKDIISINKEANTKTNAKANGNVGYTECSNGIAYSVPAIQKRLTNCNVILSVASLLRPCNSIKSKRRLLLNIAKEKNPAI
jgi:hypothetical protein